MWSIIIPILTLVAGFFLGFFVATKVLRKEMMKMQNDPSQIQAIAKSMGVNMSQKQLNMVTRQMQSADKKKAPAKAQPKKKK